MVRVRFTAVAVAAWICGCATPEEPIVPQLAKGGSGPTVDAANPSFAHEGDLGVPVTVIGSGFDAGSQASWQRNGVTDPKIAVRSTQFVSPTQLVATIDVATDAALSLYDIAVTTSGGRKGIGTAKFEVTQAQPVIGTETVYGANDAGELAGRVGSPGAFYYSPVTGLDTLGAPGRAFDISEDGRTVVGWTGACCAGAFVYQNVGGSWQYTILPKTPGANNGARGVASDPATGAAVYVAGFDFYRTKGTNYYDQPVLWSPNGSGWVRNPLPAPSGTDSQANDVNASGGAVGAIGGRATIWLPSGSGSWVATTFGGAGSQAWAVNSATSIVVGSVGSGGSMAAQYWTPSGGTWVGHGLPGGCSEAVDVDNAGRILANGCVNGNRRTPGVISPPYGSGDVRLLGALGDASGTATASRMSANGVWIAGSATLNGQGTGVRWYAGLP